MVETASDRNDVLSADPAFADLLEELSHRIQSGDGVDLTDYLTRYPQYQDQLEKLVPAMQALVGIGQGSPAAGSADGAASAAGAMGGRLGDFRILREIGRGGMGVVYEAEQISLRRRVALKMLPFAGILDEQSLKRFQNEALAAASLNHPNIVSVYFVGCDRGVHYYAMQLIEGQSLAEMIDELQRVSKRFQNDVTMSFDDMNHLSDAATEQFLPGVSGAVAPAAEESAADSHRVQTKASTETRKDLQAGISTVPAERRAYFRAAAEIGVQAAEALDYAHAHGILHRDVKPGNLLVDVQGKVFLTDFGLARMEANAAMTMTGDILGTLRYMCPESAAGGRERMIVDQRGDIYSLGVTLYELLTLQPAFAGRDRKELFQKIIFTEPIPLRRINKAIPANLETIVLKAMRKDPASRYATAGELADDLRRFLQDEPIRAKRPTVAERTRMWSRRNRAIVTAAMIVLAMIAAGSTITAMISWQEQRRTAEALRENQIVVDFFDGLLRQASPKRARKGPVTVLEALADAESIILKDFKGGPQARASIHRTIGRAYRSLEKNDLAERHLTLARDMFHELLGADHRETLSTMADLAATFSQQGKAKDAKSLYEEVLRVQLRTLGEEDYDTLVSMQNVALCQNRLGSIGNAVALGRKVLEIRRRVLGGEDPKVLVSMNQLAAFLDDQGNYDEARTLFEQALEIESRKLGPDHLETLFTSVNLANVMAHQGKNEEAIVRLEQTLIPLRSSVVAQTHSRTLGAMGILVGLYANRGQLEKALALNEEEIELERKSLGPENPQTVTSMSKRAALLIASELKFDEAREILDFVIAAQRRTNGLTHTSTLKSLGYKARLLDAQGMFDEARAAWEQLVKLSRESLGSDHPSTLGSIHELALHLMHQGEFDEARGLFESVLPPQRKLLGPEHPSTLNTMHDLANLLRAQGKRDDAIKLHRQVLEIRRRVLPPDHPFTLYSVQSIACLLREQGKYDEARALFEDTLQVAQRTLGPQNSKTLDFMAELASELRDEGKYDEARALFEEILQIAQRTLGPENPKTLGFMGDLARQLVEQKQFEEALALAQKTLDLQERLLGKERSNILYTQDTLAGALEGVGRWSDAHQLREQVVDRSLHKLGKKHPDRAVMLRGLALNIASTADATAEDRNRAMELAKEAMELVPDVPASSRVLGVVFAADARWKDALDAFERALQLGYRGELLPAPILVRIDQPENQADEAFQRLMTLSHEKSSKVDSQPKSAP